MPSHLAVIDLDDTLLDPAKRVSPANRAALDRLRAAGFAIAIASGRHYCNILLQEPLTGPADWIVSSNGATARFRHAEAPLFEHTLAEADALELLEAARRLGATPMAYHREGSFAGQQSLWTEAYARISGWRPQIGLLETLAATEVQKILFVHDPAVLAVARPELERAFASRFYIVDTAPEILEFLSPRANKRNGAQVVASRLGISAENVAAFGDGHNDVEMLAWAGLSVAMGHGRSAARRAARFVTTGGDPGEAFARGVEQVLAALEDRDLAAA